MILRTILLMSLVGSSALAEEEVEVRQVVEKKSPFDNILGLGAYGAGKGGAYSGGGVGGRIRLEPWSWLGVDLFGEALLIDSPTGIRHDHPIGFNLYVPIRLGPVRLRPLLGACVTFSFIHPTEPDAPRADDVLFGAHAGVGFELALHRRLSFFVEGKAIVWVGHDRSVQGWTGAVGNEMTPFVVGQGNVGLMFHLWER